MRVIPVRNEFFGGNIGVTGLLVGEDLERVLAGEPAGHRYLLPDVCLSSGRFLDGTTPAELSRPVEIVATDGQALRRPDGLVMNEHEGWPIVAIVGRPNVGKSTLLNRIVGRREAIVEEKPGVTRDRKEVEAEWNGRQFIAVDTGGWLPSRDSLDAKVSEQSEKAMRSADVIMLVVDATVGVIEEDAQVANVLRKLDTPVVVVANKIDDVNRESSMWEFLKFGLGEPSGISALHGRGTGDMLDRVVALLPEERPLDETRPDDDDDERRRPEARGSSRWRSSAGPTSASRRCSTA